MELVHTEPWSCVKVEVAVQDLIILMVSVNVQQL